MYKVIAKFPDDLLAKGRRIMPTDGDLQTLGGDAIDVIKKRTLGGVDVNGSAFDAYSASYKKYRGKHGRQTEPVNLSYHGRMLASMSTRSITNGVQLYFSDTQRGIVAAKHQAGDNVPRREFFGLNNTELQRLTQKLATLIRGRAR